MAIMIAYGRERVSIPPDLFSKWGKPGSLRARGLESFIIYTQRYIVSKNNKQKNVRMSFEDRQKTF